MSRKKVNFEDLINEALTNIRQDREKMLDLVHDLIAYTQEAKERHSQNGPTLAKYFESLQRSNEQAVKIASLIQKQESNENSSLSDLDKGQLFNLLKENNES